MRRVTDTVPEELCVCIPCPVEQTMKYVFFFFFWKWQHCSNSRYFLS